MRFRIASLAALVLAATACGGGSTPGPGACTPTVTCATAACGIANGCGGTCGQGGLPCLTSGATRVEGGLTLGAASFSGPSHQVRGTLAPGAPEAPLIGASHVVEQGTLR